MKFRNIFIAGLSALAFASCSDYLDVPAPSQNELGYVYSDQTEMGRALNGVYASMLVDNTYGDKLYSTYVMNTDVDFKSSSSQFLSGNAWSRYDADPDGGDINNTWAAQYKTIELANMFVEGVEGSPLYNPEDEETYANLRQMVGEAKVLRAIVYHDLTWMFGDVPFTFSSSRVTGTTIHPVTDRAEVLDNIIADLESICEDMKFADELEDGVERVSKEMAWAMIARIAQTAAGYTLRPEGDTYGKMERMNPENWQDYYKTVIKYADKVIKSGKHDLNKQFYQVFSEPCQLKASSVSDDVIWEIPFAKESTGQVGYNHGPQMDSDSGVGFGVYGESKVNAALNALYRFQFDPEDIRRDYVNCLIKYNAPQGEAILHNAYVVQNGKWSKLWGPGLGAQTTKNTGINFPFMRYTDVLLMYAEAVNETEDGVSGANGAAAKESLAKVRRRAFSNAEKVDGYIAARTSQDDFRKAVLDERKWEFAGENMRWRDLVRHNMLNEIVYWSFYRYLSIAELCDASSDNAQYVSTYDFGRDDAYDKMPFHIYYVKNVDNKIKVDGVEQPILPVNQFPNQDVKVARILNPYEYAKKNDFSTVSNLEDAEYMNWAKEGSIKNEIHFSHRGYIYLGNGTTGLDGVVYINNNGNFVMDNINPSSFPTAKDLPVIRYILPIPRAVLSRSGGQYVNKYGYK